MTTYHCQRCGRDWVPRTEAPRTCPTCRSPYWDRPALDRTHNRTCLRCGHTWHSRLPDPRQCAKCKSYYWRTPR